jgi:hypothetical protein
VEEVATIMAVKMVLAAKVVEIAEMEVLLLLERGVVPSVVMAEMEEAEEMLMEGMVDIYVFNVWEKGIIMISCLKTTN